MRRGLIDLAEELVFARPSNETEAKAALEWIAVRAGKGFEEFVEEYSSRTGGGSGQGA